jgi:hypothetical protein
MGEGQGEGDLGIPVCLGFRASNFEFPPQLRLGWLDSFLQFLELTKQTRWLNCEN